MNAHETINQLYVISVSVETLNQLREQLVKEHFYFTQIESSGGIIQKESISLLVGIPQSRAEALLRLIRKCCKRRKTFIPARVETTLMSGAPLMIETEVGGALIYALEVEQFEQF